MAPVDVAATKGQRRRDGVVVDIEEGEESLSTDVISIEVSGYHGMNPIPETSDAPTYPALYPNPEPAGRIASPPYMNRKRATNRSTRRIRSVEHKEQPYNAERHKHRHYNPPLPEPEKDKDVTCAEYFWGPFTRFCTLLVPDCFICKKGKVAKQAWREKVTIFLIMILSNVFFLVVFSAIPLFFCNKSFSPLSHYHWYSVDEGSIIGNTCTGVRIVTYIVLYGIASLLVLQCICSLIMGMNSLCFRLSDDRPFSANDMEAPVMVMVPCYNEGEKELRKTITSIVDTDYPTSKKVMVIVADGIITGRGEWTNTPRTLAKILGFEVRKNDEAHPYKSIGATTENRASVYHGTYHQGRKSLKYIVVIKRGLPSEKDSAKPGNRGKRDSQLIVMGMFNRVHHYRRLNELDTAMCNALKALEVPLPTIQYLLAIDADTRISVGSMCHMVYNMDIYPEILACCGETRVDNKAKSWVTMIQVYEYFASHHLKKSFESIFGCVTCLPGCFTMYRMFSDDCRPLLSADGIVQAYSRNDIESLHEKNLYHLGEDRMLTTILLQCFPDMRLSFVPLAACWTVVPDKFSVLLSQRRRWINSTFHNMWELLKVNTMCGVCCLSMNAVVLLDMISTLILPAMIIYTGAFVYVVVYDQQDVNFITIISFAVILGVQVVIFLVRSRCDYLLWFVIYLIFGIPVFYFILPLYSFWHMDDFSWGSTRQVAEKKGASNELEPDVEKGQTRKESLPEPRKKEAMPVPRAALIDEKALRTSSHSQRESRKSSTIDSHRPSQRDGQRDRNSQVVDSRQQNGTRQAARDDIHQIAMEKPPTQPSEGQVHRRTHSWDSAYKEAEQYLAEYSASDHDRSEPPRRLESGSSGSRSKKSSKARNELPRGSRHSDSRRSEGEASHSYAQV
jgi:chitin synthase